MAKHDAQPKGQSQPKGLTFEELARELEADEDEGRFEETLKRIAPKVHALPDPDGAAKVCPECGHTFKGNGWDGIDAHWRSKHEGVMPYEEAWSLIRANRYVQGA